MHILLWVSIGTLAWVHVAYPALVSAAARLRRAAGRESLPPAGLRVAVVIACHNEEARIVGRLQDIHEQTSRRPDRPDVRVVVVADRCTDETAALARRQGGVSVLEIADGLGGRAQAHNVALATLEADVVVFTDAGTRFSPGFLDAILAPFADPSVGCVVGNLQYRRTDSSVGASETRHFSRERKLREGEAILGLLATGTGACMAVRRHLFRPLDPTHDTDFITPLDVALRGFRVVVAPDAIAYDTPPTTVRGLWRVRVRQTARNLSGTVERWWDLSGWRRPMITLGLLSHKILRWMTGFFLMAAALSAALLAGEGAPYEWLAIGLGLFWVAGLGGIVLAGLGLRLGPLSVLCSFVWASIAMAVGSLVALVGRAQATYEAAEPDQR